MENVNDLSSSLSFTSSYLSNGSNGSHGSVNGQPGLSTEHLSLSKLSDSLEKLLVDPQYDYSDAEIVVEGVSVSVNQCILAARSQYFHDFRQKGSDKKTKEGKPQYLMSELVPQGRVGCEAFKVFLNYLYTGKLKSSPPEVSTCVEDVCAHDACGPAINYAVELMYASSTFQMKELVQVVQRRLWNFVDKALVEDAIPILVAAFHCQLSQLLSHCIQRVSRSDLDNVALEKELPYEVFEDVKSLRLESEEKDESVMLEKEPPREDKRLKSIRRIHMALDSDDIELVTLLLNESDSITLDDANALHYAVAYCDPKIVKEVLSLGLADVNLRNARDHTVLHVAARRKEPSFIVHLLNKGASALETTSDGQTAVAICRRLTRPKDYHENIKQGDESNKDRTCIDLLEREMRRNSICGNLSNASHMTADIHVSLSYLENRVAFAHLLFPTEAKLAMEMADADITSEYPGLSRSRNSSGHLREVDLNETPTVRAKRLQEKMRTLIKTVEKGRRFFPHCSAVLDEFLDNLGMGDYFLEEGTPEEQKSKRRRFLELKADVQKAFSKDMAEKSENGLTST